jgi:hypothetical protein
MKDEKMKKRTRKERSKAAYEIHSAFIQAPSSLSLEYIQTQPITRTFCKPSEGSRNIRASRIYIRNNRLVYRFTGLARDSASHFALVGIFSGCHVVSIISGV